jgi:hypothetical protein
MMPLPLQAQRSLLLLLLDVVGYCALVRQPLVTAVLLDTTVLQHAQLTTI